MIIKISALRNSWLKKSVVHEKTYHDRLPWKNLNFFQINFKEVRSTCGLYQCLLRLHTLPVSVVHGQGATARDSHVEAARNALQYLAIVASEKTQSAAQSSTWKKKEKKKRFYLNIIFWVVVVVTFWFNWDEQKSPPLRLYFTTDHLVAPSTKKCHHTEHHN